MLDYRQMLEDGFTELRAFGGGGPSSRLEYLSDFIFDFTTYDGEMSELFASKALEVCEAISNRTTYDYIKEPESYRWFLLMCNMPFFADRIEWGTSIRGAWWGGPPGELIEFSSSGLFLDGEQVTEPLRFTDAEWSAFIAAVLTFARAGDKDA